LDQSIDGLTHIHFNDIHLDQHNFPHLLVALDKCSELESICIENINFSLELFLVSLAEKLAVNNKFSLREFKIGKNKISKENLDNIFSKLKGFIQLELIDITCLKNIHEWTLEDLIDSLKKLEDESRQKTVEVNFSEHFFNYFCRDHLRPEAIKMINEVCTPLKIYFHPMDTEEKARDE
jgi:hypothetical protein